MMATIVTSPRSSPTNSAGGRTACSEGVVHENGSERIAAGNSVTLSRTLLNYKASLWGEALWPKCTVRRNANGRFNQQTTTRVRVLLRHKIAGLSGGGIDRTRDLEVEPFTCKSSNSYIRARIRLMPSVLVLLKQPR